MEHLDKVTDQLNLKQFAENKYIVTASEKTGLKPEQIVLIVGVLLILFILFSSAGRAIIVTLLFFFYPAYKSFNALVTEQGTDDKKWLTYWVILGFVFSFSGIFDLLVGWLWGADLLKYALLLYVMHPRFDGHQVVYDNCLKPLLVNYENNIDKYINKAEKELKKKLAETKKYTGEKVAEHLFN